MIRPLSYPLVFVLIAVLVGGLAAPPVRAAGQDQTAGQAKADDQQKKEKEKAKEKEQEKPVRITEEIQVIGKAPKDVPLATVTTIDPTALQRQKPLDMAEALRYAPGAMVTVGGKGEYTLKLRGIDSSRISLLVDGVQMIEPYFGSFDLKTVSSGAVESVQVTKGPSSVLYGPNTLGGIVNVITRRPSPDPLVQVTLSQGSENTRGAGADAAMQFGRVGVTASLLSQDSNGFTFPDPTTGDKTDRALSDYKRFNLTGKVIYTPSDKSEIMFNVSHYRSEYGIPPDLFGRPRYWRFSDWERTSVSAGGYTTIGDRAVVRLRTYYVNYYNVLDQYADSSMTAISATSTYDNPLYGIFGLGEVKLAGWNTLKASLYYENDKTRQQDNTGLPWNAYSQSTFSAGLEDHIALHRKWTLIGGISLDSLNKYGGGMTTKANPLVGLKFTPTEALDFHVSLATKSKFPSMRALYSSTSGNPDLKSESAQSAELSVTYNLGFYLTASGFLNDLHDFINTVRLPDGTRRYYNVNQARINGFEVQAQKIVPIGAVSLSAMANYTFLDHWNESDNRPLDALPKHELSFDLGLTTPGHVRVGLIGIWASDSWWWNTSTSSLLTIPAYFSLDGVLSVSLRNFEPFLRLTNVFNAYYYTEPGFPWRGRFIEVGVKTGLD